MNDLQERFAQDERVRLGMLARIGTQLEQRVRSSPEDARLRGHLAENYRERGELARAAAAYAELVARGQAGPVERELHRLFAGGAQDRNAADGAVQSAWPPPFLLIDDALPPADMTALRALLHRHADAFRVSGVFYGDGQPGEVDRTLRNNLEMAPAGLRALLAPHIERLLPELFERLGCDPFEVARLEIKMTRHDDGAFFTPHRDNVARGRRITMALYFDDAVRDFEGGDLLLYDEPPRGFEPFDAARRHPHTRIRHRHNRLVFFRADAMHEVTRVQRSVPQTGGARYAVIGHVWAGSGAGDGE